MKRKRGLLMVSTKSLWGITLLCLCMMFVLVGCEKKEAAHVSALEQRHSGEIRNEQHWIVQSVIDELVRMSAFAAKIEVGGEQRGIVKVSPKEGGGQGYSYSVEVNLPQRETIRAELGPIQYVWNPEVYAGFAREVLNRLQVIREEGGASIEGNPLLTLSNLRTEVMQNENRRISSWLTAHPQDAVAHEQAALLVGTLALRENSGDFWDPKDLCSRTTSHLAFARALQPERKPAATADVAEILVGLMADTKKDCEQRIEALASRGNEAPELKPWVTAARLRNRRDYRILTNPSGATLLEKIEFFRAAGEAGGSSFACKLLGQGMSDPLPDWSRIIFQFQFTVPEGHTFSRAALQWEFEDVAKVFPEAATSKMSGDSLAQVLNREPGHCVTKGDKGTAQIEVVDPGTWAMFFQRHIFHSVGRIHYFLAEMWGVPAQAKEFRKFATTTFDRVTLFPFVAVTVQDRAWLRDEKPRVEALIRTRPEWVNDTLWVRYIQQNKMVPPQGAPEVKDWFLPGVPVGTAYRFGSRAMYLHQIHDLDDAGVKPYFEMAPWSYSVAYKLLMARSGGKPNATQCREVFGHFLDYYLPAMLWYASTVKDEPAEYEKVMRHMAEVEPLYLLALGTYLAELNKKKEAAEAFEAAIAREADPISISNNCDWLVNYYVDTGRTDQAIEVATMAAEVYSSGGLETMAKLMERLGRLSEAEDYFKKRDERYGSSSSLSAFYFRQSRKQPDSPYAKRYASLEKAMFPSGVRDAVLANFKGAPTRGVLIAAENDLLRKAGMRNQEIIVALDGKVIDSFEQYGFLRELTDSDDMSLIVYNPSSGAYRQVNAKVPGRRFGLDFRTYSP